MKNKRLLGVWQTALGFVKMTDAGGASAVENTYCRAGMQSLTQ